MTEDLLGPDDDFGTAKDPFAIDELRADIEMSDLADRGTDLDNSAFFSRRMLGQLLFDHPSRSWMIYDGKRWAKDQHGAAVQLAKDCVREMQRLAAALKDDNQRLKAMKHALGSQSRRRIEAMMYFAQSDLPADSTAFDRDHYALNLMNGTLDVRTRHLRPHSPQDFITKLAPIPYDPKAECHRWLAFVLEIMNGDLELVDFLQRFIGLCLTGVTVERLLAILHGVGANGKTTLLNIIGALLGDYGATVDPALFVAQHDARAASPELVRLAGIRFVSASELPEGGKLSEGLLKRLTGNDPIAARALYADVIEIRPTWKIAFASNHRPVVRDNSEGFWDRLHLVPFDARFEGADRDPNLSATLATELPGILNWALDGFDRWQQFGMNRPARVSDATNAYRAESDVLAAFIADRCTLITDARIRTTTLYEAFRAWAKAAGERPMSDRSLKPLMLEKGFAIAIARGVRFFSGITLAGENEPPNDPNSDEEKTEDSNGVHGVHVYSDFPLTFPKHSPRETYGKMAPYVHPAPNGAPEDDNPDDGNGAIASSTIDSAEFLARQSSLEDIG